MDTLDTVTPMSRSWHHYISFKTTLVYYIISLFL